MPPHSKSAQDPNGRASGTVPGADRPLSPEDVARASQLLVAHMGPIAPILAKRAAKPGSTREQFIAALASHLKDESARARFLDSLGEGGR